MRDDLNKCLYKWGIILTSQTGLWGYLRSNHILRWHQSLSKIYRDACYQVSVIGSHTISIQAPIPVVLSMRDVLKVSHLIRDD